MRDYDAILADASDRSPFSNGTSGEMWMGRWCYQCKHDGPFQRGEADQGCTILLVALQRLTPKEWTETGLQDYHCSEFDNDNGGGGEAAPAPWPTLVTEMDGQTDIFAEFADQVTEKAVPAHA